MNIDSVNLQPKVEVQGYISSEFEIYEFSKFYSEFDTNS